MISAALLLRELLQCPSVTPADAGAQAVLKTTLAALGFEITSLRFGDIENFFAERKGTGRHLCFAGHSDVVPAGEGWSYPPFAAQTQNGLIYGRGAVDMKGAIAAFIEAVSRVPGHVSLLITGDEEGEAVNGTMRVLAWMQANAKLPDFCVVGEPTSRATLGDMLKVGRRGSLNAEITVKGRQGHVAYPHLATNAVHQLLPLASALTMHQLDSGSECFQASSLQITSIDVGNQATNVIPGTAKLRLNIRFNDLHSGASLTDWLQEMLAQHAPGADLTVKISGESFVTKSGDEVNALAEAIEHVTGLVPVRDTGGGTSDARFITHYCPVAEFGLVGATMHKTDEAVPTQELAQLVDIYEALIRRVCV